MRNLKAGQKAPGFQAKDYLGNTVNLEQLHGKKILLSFHVFASCPFCNLRINELKNRYPEWCASGFEMIHVFPSPGKTIARYAGKDAPLFPIVADPDKKLYALYGLRKSVIGLFMGFFKLSRLLRAFRIVSLVESLTNNDSDMRQLPADFLIDEKGYIQDAFYAKTVSDNLPMERIDAFLGLGLKAA